MNAKHSQILVRPLEPIRQMSPVVSTLSAATFAGVKRDSKGNTLTMEESSVKVSLTLFLLISAVFIFSLSLSISPSLSPFPFHLLSLPFHSTSLFLFPSSPLPGINECNNGLHLCPESSVCTNAVFGYTCKCDQGDCDRGCPMADNTVLRNGYIEQRGCDICTCKVRL